MEKRRILLGKTIPIFIYRKQLTTRLFMLIPAQNLSALEQELGLQHVLHLEHPLFRTLQTALRVQFQEGLQQQVDPTDPQGDLLKEAVNLFC